MTIDLFVPCLIDQFHPETAFNTVKLLRKVGIEVNYNPEQTCCGQFAFNNGYLDEARQLGVKFLRDFPNDRYIVSPSASCVGFVRNRYKELFYNTSRHLEYKRVVSKIYELSDFLVNVAHCEEFGADFPYKVAVHDSCAAIHQLGIQKEVRQLLSKVSGIKLIELQKQDSCCGFGGSFSLKHEPLSIAMAKQKVDDALESGAEYLVSTDWSCLLHLESYIKKNSIPLKVVHLADILASGITNENA